MRIFIVLIFILFVTLAFASDPTSGWHWYEEPQKEAKKEVSKNNKKDNKTVMKQIKPPESKENKTQNVKKEKQYNTSVKNY